MSGSRLESYIEDIPMKLSNRYQPRDLCSSVGALPVLVEFDRIETELLYNFQAELDALEVAEMRAKEKEKEEDEEKRLLEAQMERMSVASNEERSESSEETSSCSAETRPKEFIVNQTLEIKPNPRQLRREGPDLGPRAKSPHYGGRVRVAEEVAVLVPSVPQPSQGNHFLPTNVVNNSINPRDFESESSSPFDDALLRAIDDKQELGKVFQQFYYTKTSNSVLEKGNGVETNFNPFLPQPPPPVPSSSSSAINGINTKAYKSREGEFP